MCRGFRSSNKTCWPELYTLATCLFGYKFAAWSLQNILQVVVAREMFEELGICDIANCEAHSHTLPRGCQRRWRLGSSQGCECKSWIILHTPNLQKCDLLRARISVGVLILNGLQEIQHCCTTLLDRNGASLHLCSAGHEAQAYHFGFHSWIDRYFSYVSRTFVLAFSLNSVLEIPIHVFEFNAFLSKSGAQIRAKILFYAEKQFFSSTVGHWPNRSKTLQIASKLQNSKESKELDPIVGTGTWSKNKQSCPEILQWPSNPQIRLWTK